MKTKAKKVEEKQLVESVDKPPFFTINGKDFLVENLPQEVISLISVYQKWETELTDQKSDVFKTEAACRAVAAEITARLQLNEAPITQAI